MNKILIIALVIFFQLFSAAEGEDCYETAMTQSAMNACARTEYHDASTILDELISELKETLPEEPEKKLISSQEAWDQVVKDDCEIESWYVDGGSARPMIVSGCFTSHAVARIRMLAPLLCHPMKSSCEAMEKYEEYL